MKFTDEQLNEFCKSAGIDLTEFQFELLKKYIESDNLTLVMSPRMGYLEARYLLNVANTLLFGKVKEKEDEKIS